MTASPKLISTIEIATGSTSSKPSWSACTRTTPRPIALRRTQSIAKQPRRPNGRHIRARLPTTAPWLLPTSAGWGRCGLTFQTARHHLQESPDQSCRPQRQNLVSDMGVAVPNTSNACIAHFALTELPEQLAMTSERRLRARLEPPGGSGHGAFGGLVILRPDGMAWLRSAVATCFELMVPISCAMINFTLY